MVSVFGAHTRILVSAAFIASSLMWSDTARAQTTDVADYVIAQFGAPPAVPDGPLSDTVQQAVKTAFIDSVTQSAWDRDQSLALSEIVDSKDPRLVWLISDLMRFAFGQRLTGELRDAASALLGTDIPSQNHWGVVTDHLIAWDIPAPPDYLEG